MLGGQLGSTLRSILCLAIDWAVCCVEPHDEQHLCLADKQHLRWAARCTAYCDGQYVVLSGMMGGMIWVARPVGQHVAQQILFGDQLGSVLC